MPGLYVHIPFCARKCRYCDFPSVEGLQAELPAYLQSLFKEMRAFAALYEQPYQTVFLGGGTPSLLSGEQLYSLMQILQECFSLAPDAEITMECNPGTVDLEKLKAYRQAGVNRLSLGLQSLDDSLLARIGRIHTAQQFFEAYAAAREVGFTNISADCMHGLPGQSAEQYLNTLLQLISLEIPHISAYQLILEEGTPLFKDVKEGAETLPDEALVYDMQDSGMTLLEESGYIRYEISNFALPGSECLHNINYWENGPYLGLGAGAHSAWRMEDGWTRWENAKDVRAYIQSDGEPERILTHIPADEEAFETVMLGLRMTRGIHLESFQARFGYPFEIVYPKATERLKKAKWLVLEDGYARLTPHGMDMENIVLQYFIPGAI